MSRVFIEPEALNQQETPSAVLLRLWNDIEQMPAVHPTVPPASVPAHAGVVPTQRREAAEVAPTRVRYGFD